jgi:predicted nucleic-acid-binding protein
VIALDTNILIRLFVRDDPRQTLLVDQLIQSAVEAGEPCFITDAVLCEIEWVLTESYGARREDVLAAMQELMAQDIFVFDDREAFRQAINSYQRGKAEFSDFLIGAKGQARGGRTTYTFDRVLSRHEGFTLLA